MFKKNGGKNGESTDNSALINKIIESIMRFTGAENLSELEEIVLMAEQEAADSEAKEKVSSEENTEKDLLYSAVKSIRENHSVLDAKEMEKNQDFVTAVLAGIDAEKAYKMAKCEQLVQEAYKQGEENGKNSVKRKEDRIDEIGMTVSGGYKAEIDPSAMTMEDLKKIKERLRKGEKINL